MTDDFTTRLRSLFPGKNGKVNQSQVADAFGVSQATVSRWLSGSNPVPAWALKLVAHEEGVRKTADALIQDAHKWPSE